MSDYLLLTTKKPGIATDGFDIEVDGDVTEQENEERDEESREIDESPWPGNFHWPALNSFTFTVIDVISKPLRKTRNN